MECYLYIVYFLIFSLGFLEVLLSKKYYIYVFKAFFFGTYLCIVA